MALAEDEAWWSVPASSPAGAFPPAVEGEPAELAMAAATPSRLLPASLDTVIVVGSEIAEGEAEATAGAVQAEQAEQAEQGQEQEYDEEQQRKQQRRMNAMAKSK